MRLVAFERVRMLRLIMVLLGLILTVIPVATASPTAAQGTATIEITNVDADTGLPAPFTRFQATSEKGTVYGPLETDLNGYLAFSVTVDPQGTSFMVIEETPPACATSPEPQTTGALMAGDLTSLTFSTQDNPGCGLGTIALYAMACPDGFSGPADDYGPWRDGCTGTSDGASFTLTSVATAETWNPTAGAYGIPGRAPVVGLPSGDYTIQQNGGTPASVFCLIYDTANYATSPEPSSIVPVTLTNGVGTISLTGNRISCDLFTVPGGADPVQPTVEPVDPAAAATLDVHLAECPAEYVAGDTMYDDCHGNGIAGIPVQLSSTNGYSGTLASTVLETPGPGVARFTDLAMGTYTVSASLPSHATYFTYCSDDAFVEVPSSFDAANRTLMLDLAAGQIVTCDWYVVPNQVEPAVGTSYLEIHALQCPAGTNPNDALYDLCHGIGVAGVTFSAEGPNAYASQQTTTVPSTPGPGIATFSQLVDSNYAVTQANLDPSAELVVYCSLADADDLVPFTTLDADTISLDLPPDTGVVCDWYTIPPQSQATTSLQVSIFDCVFNMVADESTTLAAFQDSCSPSTSTMKWTLTPDGGQPIVQTAGSAGVGKVRFDSLATNTYGLISDIPGDFNDAYIFCGVDGDALTYAGHNAVSLAIDATQSGFVCQWFNVPYNASGYSDTLTVTNYLCPPGTTTDYANRCGSSPLGGATLTLVRGGRDELNAISNANGNAAFERLIPGDYQLTNYPPAGTNIAVYVVSCTANGQEFGFSYNDQQSMSIDLDLPGAVDVNCRWYNIPPGAPTVTPGQKSGSIVVHKLLCQGKSIAQYNWDTDCVAESAPVAFSLATASGSPIAIGTTNSSGILTFTNLVNGAYDLKETSGDWCHAEADRVDSAGNLIVENDGENNVYIYNCSLQNVDNLPSTGTGADQTGQVTRVPFDGDKLWQLLFGALATLGIALLVRHGLHQAAMQSSAVNEDSARPNRIDDQRNV